MKKSIIAGLSFLLLIACTKSADDTGNTTGTVIISQTAVPATVLSTFNAIFSTSTEREWRYEDDKYTCQFNMDGQRHESTFDDNGHEVNHAVICLDAPVPAVVLAGFRSAYPNDFVYEWKLTGDNNWKAHFLRSGVKYEVTISPAGAILKAEHD